MKGVISIPAVAIHDNFISNLYYTLLPDATYYRLLNTEKFGSGFIIFYDIYVQLYSYPYPHLLNVRMIE